MGHKSLFGAIIAALCLMQTAIAIASQSLSSIEAAASNYAESRARKNGFMGVAVQIRPLDSRIGLTDCDSPLSAVASSKRVLGAISVAVSCESPAPWTVHLRGTVAARVGLPVITIPINRGDIISGSDLKMDQRRITRDLVGYVADPQDIIGKEARKHLPVGSMVRKSDIIAPQIIDRGQTVDLIARSSGLVVNVRGIALANGAAGERLLVKNVSSGKRVEGLILRNGSILIR